MFLEELRLASLARNKTWIENWKVNEQEEVMFHALELGGEVGELQNVIKKHVRLLTGLKGGMFDYENIKDEIGDVMICLDKIAAIYGVDIEQVTKEKFNKTSEKHGFTEFL